MADRPTSPDAGMEPDRGSTAGMPRWVKVSLIILVAFVLLFVGLKLTGVGGEHGPARHVPADNPSPASATEGPSGGEGAHDPSRWGHG